MTRTIKLHKLANAIRDYRGALNVESGKWIHPPKVGSWSRVVVAVSRFKNGEDLIRNSGIQNVKLVVDGFKTQAEMNNFINNL